MTAVVAAIAGAARPVLVVTPSHDLARKIGRSDATVLWCAAMRKLRAGAAVRVDKDGVLVAAGAWAGLDTPIQWASVVVPKVPFPMPTILDGKDGEAPTSSARGVAYTRGCDRYSAAGCGRRTRSAPSTWYDPRARKAVGHSALHGSRSSGRSACIWKARAGTS
jgi:hypothetical protein